MADYKQVSAYCHHCQKKVLAHKPEVAHLYWLIASIFSCGLAVIPWILAMLFYNPPAKCSVCGSEISDRAVPTTTVNHVAGNASVASFSRRTNSQEATGSGLTPTAKLVIGIVCCLFLMGVVGNVLLTFSESRIKTAQGSKADDSDDSISDSDNEESRSSPTRSTTKSSKAKKELIESVSTTKTSKSATPYRLGYPGGGMRPHALSCMNFAEDMRPRLAFKFKNMVFERCVELGGDGATARREILNKFDWVEDE